MTRSAARRTSAVQAEKTMSPASPATEHRPDDPLAMPAPATGMTWYWRLVMFLWTTSFIFLMLYEWLAGIVKSW
jgi:hypothetical protein